MRLSIVHRNAVTDTHHVPPTCRLRCSPFRLFQNQQTRPHLVPSIHDRKSRSLARDVCDVVPSCKLTPSVATAPLRREVQGFDEAVTQLSVVTASRVRNVEFPTMYEPLLEPLPPSFISGARIVSRALLGATRLHVPDTRTRFPGSRWGAGVKKSFVPCLGAGGCARSGTAPPPFDFS